MFKQLGTVEFWIYGLLSGFIGGGATAVTATGGMAAAHASGMDVPVLNLQAIGIIFLSAGISSSMAYLAKSPLPPISRPNPPENPAPPKV